MSYNDVSEGQVESQPQSRPQEVESEPSFLASPVAYASIALTFIGYIIAASGYAAAYSNLSSLETILIFLPPMLLFYLVSASNTKKIARPICAFGGAALCLWSFFTFISRAHTGGSAAVRAEASGHFFVFLGEAVCAACAVFFL